jgi:hypothetical protein
LKSGGFGRSVLNLKRPSVSIPPDDGSDTVGFGGAGLLGGSGGLS